MIAGKVELIFNVLAVFPRAGRPAAALLVESVGNHDDVPLRGLRPHPQVADRLDDREVQRRLAGRLEVIEAFPDSLEFHFRETAGAERQLDIRAGVDFQPGRPRDDLLLVARVPAGAVAVDSQPDAVRVFRFGKPQEDLQKRGARMSMRRIGLVAADVGAHAPRAVEEKRSSRIAGFPMDGHRGRG